MRLVAFSLLLLALLGCDEGSGTRRISGGGQSASSDVSANVANAILAAPIGTVKRSAARTALVIGNSRYSAIPFLDNPGSDARLMSQTLSDIGFQLIGGGAQLDLTRAQMNSALSNYRRRLASRGGIGVVYFAGHAVQINGRNWLAPTDVAPKNGADVSRQFIPAESLFGINTSGRATNLVILDACRNNPFAAATGTRSTPVPGLRGTSSGLSRVLAPRNTLVAFATAPGGVALDGSGANSPYAIALSRALAEPGTRVEDVFIRVRNIVNRITGGAQTPWETSSLTNRVVLNQKRGNDPVLSAKFDGEYLGTIKCQKTTGDPHTFDLTEPQGRLIRIRVQDGTAQYDVGSPEPLKTWDGSRFHESLSFRIRENGRANAIGVYNSIDGPRSKRKIGQRMDLKNASFTGTVSQEGLKLSGVRGPRHCIIELSPL